MSGHWRVSALCAEIDPDLWFPEKGHYSDAFTAKRICYQCPVQAECLEYALANPDLLGVWGGATVNERRLLRCGQEAA